MHEISCSQETNYTLASDILLELRHHFSSCPEVSLNQLIFRFHNLLPKVEKSHYLLCYRIRQILSKNYKIELSDPIKRVEPSEKPLALTMRSLEFEKKRFFESSGYSLPYSDIRVTVLESRK